jgi:hypothetical protein
LGETADVGGSVVAENEPSPDGMASVVAKVSGATGANPRANGKPDA